MSVPSSPWAETFLGVHPLVASVISLIYTRFERARILGARALQISMGAPSFLLGETTADPLEIAMNEFASGSGPLNVTRFRDAFD